MKYLSFPIREVEFLVFLAVADTAACNLLAEEVDGRILQLDGVGSIPKFLSREDRTLEHSVSIF